MDAQQLEVKLMGEVEKAWQLFEAEVDPMRSSKLEMKWKEAKEELNIFRRQQMAGGASALPSSASAGAGSPQLRSLWVKSPKGNAIQIPVKHGRIDVSGTGGSAAPKLGSYWALCLPVAYVELYSKTMECLDVARVDDEGFVLLDMEILGQLGESEDNAIILKFGWWRSAGAPHKITYRLWWTVLIVVGGGVVALVGWKPGRDLLSGLKSASASKPPAEA